MKIYRYYLLLRPIGIGTYPRQREAIERCDYTDKHDDGSGIEAWGWIGYKNPLTDEEIKNYDLREAKND